MHAHIGSNSHQGQEKIKMETREFTLVSKLTPDFKPN